MSDLQKKRAIFGIAVLIVVVLDQWSKRFIRLNPEWHYRSLIEGWLEFYYTSNPGMALGFDFFDTFTISLLSIAATIGIVVYIFRTMHTSPWPYSLLMGCIIGGALGNLIDRSYLGLAQGYGGFLEGHVTDFIYFSLRIGDWQVFPYIFNVADSFISVSVVTFLVFHKYLMPDENRQAGLPETPETPVEAAPLQDTAPANPEPEPATVPPKARKTAARKTPGTASPPKKPATRSASAGKRATDDQ